MEKAEVINKLYQGEYVPTNDIHQYCEVFFEPTNIRLLIKKLVILANTIEYDYLQNPSGSVFAIDFGRMSSIYDLINWALMKDVGKRKISQIAWRREMADFITEKPIKNDSNVQ